MKIIITLLISMILGSCATNQLAHPSDEITDVNYKLNIINSIEYANNFADFDKDKFPQGDLTTEDLALLIQTDFLFNQGMYANAANNYYTLAIKYQDPRIIYKSILCYEYIGISIDQINKLNQLINLLITVDPHSNTSQLFAIKIALEKNDLTSAKRNFNMIIKSDPVQTRSILLFLSTIISNTNFDKASYATLENFAKSIHNKYSNYPEAELFNTVAYSITKNQQQLLCSLNAIHTQYPNWEIPVYWSAGILFRYKDSQLLGTMLTQEINRYTSPPVELKNLYIAYLISFDKLTLANNFIESDLNSNPNNYNSLINAAIVKYQMKQNLDALNLLIKAKVANSNLNGARNLAVASLLDYMDKDESAVIYYKNAVQLNPILADTANLGILRIYIDDNKLQLADNFIENMAAKQNLDAHGTIILKISLYTSLNKYDIAYKLASSKIKLYSYDKNFVYLYASLLGLTNHTNEAIIWYNKYIQMSPMDPAGYNDLAFIYADKTSHYLLAHSLAAKAYAMLPSDPAILDTMGWVNYKLHNYNEARGYLERAYLQTHDYDTVNHLKQVYLALHMPEAANKLIGIKKETDKEQFAEMMLAQSMQILMYYQYGMALN